jgi:phosphoribosylformimino-5-aminoimidazole carboxamide ribotide isomerase
MPAFTVYPAIDLRGGKVVRLKQGDSDRQTEYKVTPARAAQNWSDQGARWLHVVNLSGAFQESEVENRRGLEQILTVAGKAVPAIKVQFGGGVRTLEDVSALLSAGVGRVILGTLAISAPDLLAMAVARFSTQALAVAIDAQDGHVQVQGWRQGTDTAPLPFAKHLREVGVETIIYTNISRDGLGTGVDVENSQQIAQESGLQVIAAGGVNDLNDIRRARQAGLSGVIIGRALYEGKFTLKEALGC